MNPYEQHRQNQFHAGSFSESIASMKCFYPPADPAILLSQSAARAIVAAIDDNRPHRAAHLIKELPWFAEILSGVRATRHLKPQAYIRLSERPEQMIESVDAVGSDGCKIGLTTFRQIP